MTQRTASDVIKDIERFIEHPDDSMGYLLSFPDAMRLVAEIKIARGLLGAAGLEPMPDFAQIKANAKHGSALSKTPNE